MESVSSSVWRFIQASISTAPVAWLWAMTGTSPASLNFIGAEKSIARDRVGHDASHPGKAGFEIGDQITRILQTGMNAHHRPFGLECAAVRLIWAGMIRLSNPPQE